MKPYLATASNIILSNTNGRCIELLHHSDDPSIWKIRRSKKFLWLRLQSSTYCFYSKQNALNFAQTLNI